METEQLYVGDERICPRTNYENDGAAEKIRQTRELLDELAVRVAEELLKKTDLADWAKRAQKPAYTAPEVGADVAGSAAGALADAKAYADGTYMQATGYTDSEIAKLINGSQTTLETIKQLSDAMQENEDIVDALENAMGSKTSEVEFQAHAANETVHVTESEKEGWNAAAEHGRSGHAPANAERNTIAGIKRNGSGLVPDRNRNVDITVPTKISQLENDVIKKIAFSGQYSDLTGAPTSLKNPQALSFSGAAAGNYDGSVAKSVHIPSGTNGLMATAAGTWLDAVQGKALKGLWDQHEAKINKINSDLSIIGTIKNGAINKTVLPLGVETIVGSIILDPGIWFVRAGVWNPLGMKTITINIQDTGIGQMVTAQCIQVTGCIKTEKRTIYNITCTQWSETSVELVTGDTSAIRLK